MQQARRGNHRGTKPKKDDRSSSRRSSRGGSQGRRPDSKGRGRPTAATPPVKPRTSSKEARRRKKKGGHTPKGGNGTPRGRSQERRPSRGRGNSKSTGSKPRSVGHFPTKGRAICQSYKKDKTCRFGSKCRFRHAGAEKETPRLSRWASHTPTPRRTAPSPQRRPSSGRLSLIHI